VWVDTDEVVIARALAKAGLVHTRRFASGWIGSGLLVASRFPITDAAFVRYELGGKPQKFWHGDFYGGKGMMRVTVATPLGPLDVACTHLHASYDTSGEYELFQIAEALEAVDFLGPRGERPLVLGADLNVDASSLAWKLLTARAQLSSIERDPGIDWILFRDGAHVTVRCVEARKVLDKDVDLGNGRSAHLSDHEGVLAVLELASGTPGPIAAATPAVASDALARVRAGLEENLLDLLARGASGLVALAVGLLLARAARRRSHGALGLRALSFALLAASALLLALGFLYGPYERRGLLSAQVRLER
jgi:endonuclease/exonuclease/phosphatase family metal-dependent hydrolase